MVTVFYLTVSHRGSIFHLCGLLLWGHPIRPNIFYYSTICFFRPFAECISFSPFLYGLSHLENTLIPGYILSTEREIPKRSDPGIARRPLADPRSALPPSPVSQRTQLPGNSRTPSPGIPASVVRSPQKREYPKWQNPRTPRNNP